MHAPSLAALLGELFAAHGWKTTEDAALEGRSGTVYGAPVLAEADGFVVLVERRGPDETIRAPLVEEMARVVDDAGADAGLLAHMGPIDGAAAQAAAGRILLWDRLTLALLVGETAIAQAADRPLPDLPLDAGVMAGRSPGTAARMGGARSTSDLLPPAFHDDGPDLDALETLGGLDILDEPFGSRSDALDAAPFGHAASAPSAPSRPGPSTGAGPAAPSGGAATLSFPALPPRVAAAEAAERVRDRLLGVADGADLVLQPVHLLDYACDLLLEGSLRYDTVEGRIEVHGTTKAVRDVEPLHMDPAKAGPLGETGARSVDERVLRVSQERAMEIARASLMETHSRTVEIETQDEDEDFVIMERKDVAPRPDQLRVQHIGVILRPHWRLTGSNGAVLVDAVTGEVAGEELRTYNTDSMVID